MHIDLEKLFSILERIDPKCPKCGKVHERTRVGESLTWVVKTNCDFGKKGILVPIELFGIKREDISK